MTTKNKIINIIIDVFFIACIIFLTIGLLILFSIKGQWSNFFGHLLIVLISSPLSIVSTLYLFDHIKKELKK